MKIAVLEKIPLAFFLLGSLNVRITRNFRFLCENEVYIFDSVLCSTRNSFFLFDPQL
jgi:hypothetical protein